jgi:hypothetical protein
MGSFGCYPDSRQCQNHVLANQTLLDGCIDLLQALQYLLVVLAALSQLENGPS